jgi:iron complex outermembrane receptor protein
LLGLRYQLGERHTLQFGLSSEYQHNRRSGWGFIIPDYEMLSFGAYAFDRYTIRENLIVNAGLRYDHVHMNIRHYEDWYKTPVGSGDSLYKQRSADLSRNFNSLTCSAGINWSVGNWVLKGNVGKGFRVPIPKELGADGINYHIFRYERGNAELKPEESYQLDLGLSWSSFAVGQEREGGLTVQLEPYLNYFPNYIYLNPTSDYVEGLQLYHYTQAKVLRYGVEAELKYVLNRHWEAGLKGEYLHARQQSGPKKGYGLPFSPPWSSDIDVKYSFHWKGQGFVALNAHIVGAQHDIVPPEQPTDGYWTLNVLAGKHFPLGKHAILKLTLHANNLLDRRYYDHTSYYRLIDVPEPGRNFSAMLGVDF